MKKTMTFTSPGKLGDCLMQWAVPFWWHRKTGKPFDVWLDQHSLKPLVPLIQAQPGVQGVELKEGMENWNCGGQPWHFNLKAEDHADRQFCHLGFRSFPVRQLTLQTMHDTYLNLDVDPADLAETPSLIVPDSPKVNRLILHGTGICVHNKQAPGFWKFLAGIRKELENEFDEVVFVGSPDDREVAGSIYPDHATFDDGGDFLSLATYMNASRLVIGCGSSVVALAQQLKVQTIRVHDAIGDAPKVIWSGLGKNQLNVTELELRTQWAEFRDQFVKGTVTV